MSRMIIFLTSSLLFLPFFSQLSAAQNARSQNDGWRTVTLERLEALSDTSSPMFRDVKSGKEVVLRCQDEGWGTVHLERVRERSALDQELGLKSWPEVEKALKEKKDAYLKSHRLRTREIFIKDESGPKHPRDDLAFFGDSERGFRFRFDSFDVCSKVDTLTSKYGEVCQVVLEVKDGPQKPSANGFVRIKSSSCLPKAAATSIADPSVINSQASPTGQGKNQKPTAR